MRGYLAPTYFSTEITPLTLYGGPDLLQVARLFLIKANTVGTT